MFTTDQPWDQDVSGDSPAGQSDAIISWLDGAGGWGTGDFRIDFSIPMITATADAPRVTLTPKDDAWAEANGAEAEFYRPDCDDGPFPLPEGGNVEGSSNYSCENGGDCHLLVVAQHENRLYEMWRGDLQGDTLLAGCVAVWELDRAYDPTLRGRGCSSADAGGFPIAAMLVTPEEVAAGEVQHALRFILPNDRIREGIYVPPGTHSTFATSGDTDAPPYGVRFRLKADFDESTLPNEAARVIARGLKKYGMFLADGGSLPLTVAVDTGRATTWESLGIDARSLSDIAVTDFEVVNLGDGTNWLDDTTCYRN